MNDNNEELREIDCKMLIHEHIKSMSQDGGLSVESADAINRAIRYLNGRPLFALYLKWIEGYKTQKAVADRLGISEPAVTKIFNRKLADLRAVLLFALEGNEELGIDAWYPDEEDPEPAAEREPARADMREVNLKRYEKQADRDQWPGETNPRVEPSNKDPDTIAAEAIAAGRAERRREEWLRAKQIRDALRKES